MTDPSNEPTIRMVCREDVPTVAAMAGEFFALLAAIDGSDAAFDVEDTAEKLERSGFGRRPLYSGLIAEKDGRAIGYAIYNLGFWADTFEGMVFLSDLFVRDGWRGCGIGRQFMGRLTEIGRMEGCSQIMWTVWSRNDAAQRFYRKLGAVFLNEEKLMMQRI